jgi:branched-chain amino acid transport system ATP-binding protein
MVLALRGRSRRKFSLFGKPDVDSAEAPQIAAALEAVRIAARADVMVKDLSYGEQRQLEIALSLVTSPRLLLLDEPAAGLSPSERSMVAGIIRSLGRDITVVLIEHDMDLALGLVDLVTCMFEGRVLVEQSPDEIRRNRQVQEVYLGRPRHA